MAPFIRYTEKQNTTEGAGTRVIVRYVNVALVESAAYDVEKAELHLRFASSNNKGNPRFATLQGEEAEAARAVIDSLRAE